MKNAKEILQSKVIKPFRMTRRYELQTAQGEDQGRGVSGLHRRTRTPHTVIPVPSQGGRRNDPYQEFLKDPSQANLQDGRLVGGG